MLVSIIVPVYNVVLENFKKCMDSLQNQTLKDIEIILIDDCGEMRECVEYAKQIQQTDARVKLLINETNSGAGYSRNRGIAEAKGEYLAFVDADDTVDLDFYEKLYEKSKEKKFDIIKGELAGEKSQQNAKIRRKLAEGKPLYEVFNYNHWTAMFRAEFIKSNGIEYGTSRVSQDVTFLLRVSVLAHSIATVDGVYYHYDRENTNSITHTTLAENVSHYCHAIQERMDFLTENVDYNDPAYMRYIEFNANRLVFRANILATSDVSNDKYKVSVIVPTYNAEDYIEELVTSFQAQSLQDYELIFVDDGSTDASGDKINEAIKKDNRISYYYQDNSGAGVARNVGLNHAKGKYVICIDADDLYHADFLEELYNAAEETEADVVVCRYKMVNYWTDEVKEDEGLKNDKIPLLKVFKGKDVTQFCSQFNPRPSNKLYRRRFIMENELRYGATRIANDVLFGYGAMILAKKIYCLPQNLMTVRRYVNDNSISSTRQKYLEDSIVAMDQLWNWAKKRELLDSDYKKQFVKLFVNMTLYNCQYGITEKFWAECCVFVGKMVKRGVSLKYIQKLYDIDTRPFEERIAELKSKPDSDKEIEMLKNKIAFIDKMKRYLKFFTGIGIGGKDSASDVEVKTVKNDKVVEGSAVKKNNTLKPAPPLSLKSRILLKIKLLLARFWPVTIKRFNVGMEENRRQLNKGIKENKKQISDLNTNLQNLIKQQQEQLNIIKQMQQSMLLNQEALAGISQDMDKAFVGISQDMDKAFVGISQDMDKAFVEIAQDEDKALEGINKIRELQQSMLENQETADKAIMEIAQKNNEEVLGAVGQVKEVVDNNSRSSMEVLWAEIFNSTIKRSNWLVDQTFSPGRWAVGYQYLYAMYRVLNEAKPTSILELGLGQSTRMISQYAAAHENVEHIVVEHDEKWAEFFENDFSMPASSKIEVLELDYVPYKNADEVRVYKDIEERMQGKKFDFISIDAPRGGDMKKYSRIDVLKMMPDCLAEDFVILIDDYNRSGEKRTVREMEEVLKASGIAYKKGRYSGMKDCLMICAEHMKFLTTM